MVSSLVSSVYVRLRSLVFGLMQRCRSWTLTVFGELLSRLLKIGRSAFGTALVVTSCPSLGLYWSRKASPLAITVYARSSGRRPAVTVAGRQLLDWYVMRRGGRCDHVCVHAADRVPMAGFG